MFCVQRCCTHIYTYRCVNVNICFCVCWFRAMCVLVEANLSKRFQKKCQLVSTVFKQRTKTTVDVQSCASRFLSCASRLLPFPSRLLSVIVSFQRLHITYEWSDRTHAWHFIIISMIVMLMTKTRFYVRCCCTHIYTCRCVYVNVCFYVCLLRVMCVLVEANLSERFQTAHKRQWICNRAL